MAYGLRLHGSWAHNEYHAFEEHGMVRSYSDVDYVCDTPFEPTAVALVSAGLRQAAASCDLELKGISIRPSSEMRDMWVFQPHESDWRQTRELRREFIQFWACVSSAEAYTALIVSNDYSSRRQQYQFNKFFLTLWRDLAIASGIRMGTYHDTLNFASNWLPMDFCLASYALKVGRDIALPWDTLLAAHQQALNVAFRRFLQGTQILEILPRALNDGMPVDYHGAVCLAYEMIEQAGVYQHDLSFRQAARMRLLSKLSQHPYE
jgi:hypothetical protein